MSEQNPLTEVGVLGEELDAEDSIIPRLDAGAAAGAAVAKEAWEVVKSGVAELMKGDIHYNGPTSEVSVRYNNPKGVALKQRNTSRTIFRYRSETPVGIEAVNVKLDCLVQYDGPEVSVTFQIPADGDRSRLASDTYITIAPPLTLESLPMPADWQRIGVSSYPVVRFPVTVFVDEPWPNDNYKQSFQLVLSGLYGFGADGLSPKENVVVTTD
jgi:hypothetical protein